MMKRRVRYTIHQQELPAGTDLLRRGRVEEMGQNSLIPNPDSPPIHHQSTLSTTNAPTPNPNPPAAAFAFAGGRPPLGYSGVTPYFLTNPLEASRLRYPCNPTTTGKEAMYKILIGLIAYCYIDSVTWSLPIKCHDIRLCARTYACALPCSKDTFVCGNGRKKVTRLDCLRYLFQPFSFSLYSPSFFR